MPTDKAENPSGHLNRAIYRLRHKKIALVCIFLIVAIYLAGIFAPWIAPYGYNEQDYTAIRQGPSLEHWAGTDLKGRDVFSRVLWGIQNTVVITFITMITGGLFIGVTF